MNELYPFLRSLLCFFLFETFQLYLNFKLTSFLIWSLSLERLEFSSLIYYNCCFSLAISTGEGVPRFLFKKSIALFGLSCSSYRPTRARVRWSITPVFSRYFLNYYFFDSVVWVGGSWYLVAHISYINYIIYESLSSSFLWFFCPISIYLTLSSHTPLTPFFSIIFS